MACCSFACSRRTLSSSSFSDRALSAGPLAMVAGKRLRACPSAERFGSCAGRFRGTFRVGFWVSAVGVIMFISSYEFVAYSVHGQKKSRLLWNWLEFLANPDDMSIHCPGCREVLVSPNLVEQPLAAQRLSRVTQKMFQELKFLTGKLHPVTATQHLVAAQIHIHVTEGIGVLLLRERLCPPQNGFHPGEQFPDRERLGDVIIGAKFKADNLVYLLAARCKHDDGNRGALGLQLFTYVQSAHAWHHDVEYDQVWRILQRAFKSFDAIERR